MSYKPEAPFDIIESVQQHVKLLIEGIEESKHNLDANIARAESTPLERQEQALHLVSNNLLKLSLTTSLRILNDLRTLRHLLLEERQLNKHYRDYKRES